MKTIRIVVVATVPDDVKPVRLCNDANRAVTEHVLRDYNPDGLRVVAAYSVETLEKGGAK